MDVGTRITVTCEVCSTVYDFDPADFDEAAPAADADGDLSGVDTTAEGTDSPASPTNDPDDEGSPPGTTSRRSAETAGSALPAV